MAREVLGHIDCPSCGTKGGMRITHDKNAEPFGYCEAGCNQQMRIGGDKRRVAAFVARYPWAAGAATVTGTGTKAEPQRNPTGTPAEPNRNPTGTPPAPVKPRSAFADAVSILAGGR